MRWLVTGARGLLGAELGSRLAEEGSDAVTLLGRGDLDVTDASAVAATVPGHDVVVNCAGWTDVDAAEGAEAEATAVNAEGARLLAAACRAAGSRLVLPSTDYVFSGETDRAYAEDAVASPRSAYGRSKAAGEEAVRAELPHAHLIVRTAWLYGAQARCFPRTIARLLRERGTISVVDDQVGQPTWAADLADLLVALVRSDAPVGTYHATAAGQTTWFGFAQEVAAALGEGEVVPTSTAAFARPAPRPAYSVLGVDRLRAVGVAPIGPWRERWAVAANAILADPA